LLARDRNRPVRIRVISSQSRRDSCPQEQHSKQGGLVDAGTKSSMHAASPTRIAHRIAHTIIRS
jgi:hypothetical protein